MKLMRFAGAAIVALVVCAVLQAAPPKITDIPPLLKQLKGADPKMRAASLQELARIAQVRVTFTRAAIPGVLEALKDGDLGVRREAARALPYLKADPKLAVPALQAALADGDPEFRSALAEALAEHRDAAKDALPTLLEIQKQLSALPKEEQQKVGNLINSVNGAVAAIRGK